MPHLNSNNLNLLKDDQLNMRPTVQMPLLPETVQTILKCIGASTNSISAELSQEIFQMNLQAKILLEKPNLLIQQQQQQQQQQQLKPSVLPNPLVGNQGTFDMLQSMMTNLNLTNLNNQNTNLNLNNYNSSPIKMISSQLNSATSLPLSGNPSVQSLASKFRFNSKKKLLNI